MLELAFVDFGIFQLVLWWLAQGCCFWWRFFGRVEVDGGGSFGGGDEIRVPVTWQVLGGLSGLRPVLVEELENL